MMNKQSSAKTFIAYRTDPYIKFVEYDELMKNNGDIVMPGCDEEQKISHLLSKKTGENEVDWIMLPASSGNLARFNYAEMVKELNYEELKKPGEDVPDRTNDRYWDIISPFTRKPDTEFDDIPNLQ